MNCFTFGGPGDPCSLSVVEDGQNSGRFKNPSQCKRELDATGTEYLAYGDMFFLWNEPDAYGKTCNGLVTHG
jgi:hypothetical protein